MIFANIMQDKEGGEKYWSKLLHKYRFVIMTDSSFEEKLSVKLSRLNVLAFIGIFVFACFFSTLLLIAYTPLSEYVPGKSSIEVQKNLVELSLKSDSLENILHNRAIYLENINNIINGNELVTPIESNKVSEKNEDEIVFDKSKEDSLLRLSVEAEDKSSIYIKSASENNYLMFFTPLTGIISDRYNSKTKHFGIDLVAKEKSRISSVLDGTVIVSHWTSETGYVIAIQHKNDYISLYKHNSLLLKEVGDFVNAGDHIAIIGNSGELSSGPHLHFELWHKGTPVNPENYISF
jgi:murein DD-endopeptidase MepM/ murein hydrolase activator NlpD|tara:strand:+ start:4438 stop:5313 length:876 start_codon:yes stop_codon:yes gene_type:complete